MGNCDCGNQFKTESDAKRGLCFGCHVRGIRFGFTYGKEDFHGPTVRERQRYYEDSDAFKQGKIEKVPARRELI